MKQPSRPDLLETLVAYDDGGLPLRDGDRVYFLTALITDVESFTRLTGLLVGGGACDGVAGSWHLGIGRLSVWPTPDDVAWWSDAVHEVLGVDWHHGDDEYAGILAEAAARLLNRQEADQLSMWLHKVMGEFLILTRSRITAMTDDLPVPSAGPCLMFDRWPSYPLAFRSGGKPYRLQLE